MHVTLTSMHVIFNWKKKKFLVQYIEILHIELLA